MAFSEIERFHLENKNLIAAYQSNEEVWKVLGEEAYGHTSKYLANPRQDDVVRFLVSALEINDEFRQILSDKKLSAHKWYQYFADLILDKTWQHLAAATQEGGGE